MFSELCGSSSNPSSSWCYRDEDFGGYLASIARRKGGAYNCIEVSSNVLAKFIAANEPIIK